MSFDTRDLKAVKALDDAQKAGNVIGLAAVTGGVVSRQDIDDLLLNDEPCFNLFLLALQALQKPEEKDNPMSYYQIAGIHGMPNQEWNNIKNKGAGGYCAHSTDTFPTWHRPYLALLEQTIYSKMVDIVKTWTPESERSTQLAAAGRFRLPFWDYWKPRGGPTNFPGVPNNGQTTAKYDFRIPDIFVASKVMVRKPESSSLQPIDNPLASFTFPTLEKTNKWSAWSNHTTKRYPRSTEPVTALNQALNKDREGASTWFLTMIQDDVYKRYQEVSTNAVRSFGGDDRNETTGSLEGLHNNYHVTIGGRGDMNSTSDAPFDPVFWIHHCQIDRLLAIWQDIYPKTWLEDVGVTNGDTELTPFYTIDQQTGKKQAWTSNKARSTAVLGYSYGDAVKGQTADSGDTLRKRYAARYEWTTKRPLASNIQVTPVFEKAQVFKYDAKTREFLSTEANRTGALKEAFDRLKKLPVPNEMTQVTLVGPIAATSSMSSRMAASAAPILENRVLPSIIPAELQVPMREELDESHIERTWYVDDIVERLALNGTFTIYYFIGEHDDGDHTLYATQPTLAGFTNNFAAPVEYCDNCGKQDEQGLKVSSTTVITPMLKDYILGHQLADLTPGSVKPFLVKNLRWRVVQNGVIVDPRTVKGLAVGISSKLKDRQTGKVSYEEHNDVITEILQGAS